MEHNRRLYIIWLSVIASLGGFLFGYDTAVISGTLAFVRAQFGLPAAIGAKAACPDKIVIDIAGDGSIQMNIQELMTAIEAKIDVKVVILNNKYLGMVRQWQELFYDKVYSSTNIENAPDFVQLAQAYGAKGLKCTMPDQVESVLSEGINTQGTVIMDFAVAREE